MKALPTSVNSVVFFLGDQPSIQGGVLDALFHEHRTTLARAVVPVYSGQRGNPVLFDRSAFEDLRRLSGDAGGRQLLRGYGDTVRTVKLGLPPPFDIDTPEDYVRHRPMTDQGEAAATAVS
jgi:molybdenum cofactor cytidylyltransferase